jgi:TetR/AcrR family transcriptional regulator, cholesterol catabolism regulator
MQKKNSQNKKHIEMRRKILRAAAHLFATKGFDGTSVRKIADRSNLCVAGMFHYFPSKEDILNDIMIGFMDEGYRRLTEIYNSDQDLIEKLEEICKFYVQQYAGHRNELTILNIETKSLSHAHRQIIVTKKRAYVKILKVLFDDLAKRDLLKAIDSSVLSFIFFGMVHWTYSWYNPKGMIGPKELGGIFSETFLRGILKRPEGQSSKINIR